jgi:hypothetical protein
MNYDSDGDMSPKTDPGSCEEYFTIYAFIFGRALIYDPKIGELPPFQNLGVSISQTLGSIFFQKEVQAATGDWAA